MPDLTAGGRRAQESAPSAPPDLTTDRELASLLVRLDALRRLVEHRARLGAADMRLLWLLSDRRPLTLREISDALGLEQSTVNRQVNAALKAGLVTRTREAGRAAQLVAPTDAGMADFETELAEALGRYAEGLAPLGDRGRPFLDDLETFVDAYAKAVRREEWAGLGRTD